MIYTELTRKAMVIAYRAHHGQVDHSGVPYVFHPLHLAEEMTDEYATCAALLHDVVEDTSVTLEELAQDFPREVMEAVALLTHEKGEPYFDYIRRIKENPIARAVKLADLRHNTDRTRLADGELDKGAIRRYEEKYKKAFELLK